MVRLPSGSRATPLYRRTQYLPCRATRTRDRITTDSESVDLGAIPSGASNFAQSPRRAFDAGPSPEQTAGLLQEEGWSAAPWPVGELISSHNFRSRSAAD